MNTQYQPPVYIHHIKHRVYIQYRVYYTQYTVDSTEYTLQLNIAYNTLKCPHARGCYLLKIAGMPIDEDEIVLDPKFLLTTTIF